MTTMIKNSFRFIAGGVIAMFLVLGMLPESAQAANNTKLEQFTDKEIDGLLAKINTELATLRTLTSTYQNKLNSFKSKSYTYSLSQAKNDKRNGKITAYKGTALVLEGTLKRDKLNGKLKTYYDNGQIEYEGSVKNNNYNGKGTLYDEDGNIVYSGKWKNGNYAS